MKQLIAVHRITNAEELLTAIGRLTTRAKETLSDDIYRLGVYEETLSDGSKVTNFWIRPETPAETKREKS